MAQGKREVKNKAVIRIACAERIQNWWRYTTISKGGQQEAARLRSREHRRKFTAAEERGFAQTVRR